MEEKTPLIRVVKNENLSKTKIWCIRLSAFVVAILLGCLIFVICGANPIAAYGEIIKGAIGKSTGIKQTIKIATPLLGAALALGLCFKMKYWNCGAEGQITMGALGAAFFAINFGTKLPSIPLLLLMCVGGVVCGAVWGLIPALFKSRWNTNETLFTLMLNYIAIGIVAWLQGGPWEGKPGSQIVPNFPKAAVLPKVMGIQCGWILIILLVFVMFFYMNFTKQGYEIAVLGESENTARYAGMNVGKVIIRTAAISGGICGLVGFMVASGVNQTIYSGIAGGVGFTAITVAWLAQLNPFAMTVIAFLLAVLSKGSSALQTAMGVPSSVSEIIKGILLLCLLGCEFFINYKMILRSKKEAK
ncbi:MAG: ABC transporter permease [Erysipelotrichaceae bacterium]|nr:ABC transporter permease [Erysipelotrichaceae bacterium]